mmetsp:Transcript_31576/g.55974  ORF Transcript_31576/g.55974 Transcript_31576/m.55974 type:complete len:348 (+) Transcript_31576:2-1045(+)
MARRAKWHLFHLTRTSLWALLPLVVRRHLCSAAFAMLEKPGDSKGVYDSKELRVVSYNVCGFGAGFGEADEAKVTDVYGKLREDLSVLKPDLICLNEVKRLKLRDPEGNLRDDSLEALAEDLDEMEYFFAHANPGYDDFGNAMLVGKRLQVIHCDSVHLDGGSVISLGSGATKHIGRGCISVCVSMHERRFALLGTHWDHISEAERRKQANSLLLHSPQLSHKLPHLVLGDLNAMKRADYNRQEWAALDARNKAKHWAPPEDSSALVDLEMAGYRDLHQRPRDTFASWLGMTAKKDPPWTKPGDPPARIDYIYASKDFGEVGVIKAAFAAKATGSDHLPLVADVLLA